MIETHGAVTGMLVGDPAGDGAWWLDGRAMRPRRAWNVRVVHVALVTAAVLVASGAAPAAHPAERPVAVVSSTASGDPVDAYIRQVYADLFSRAPDPTGLEAWGDALRTGTSRRAVADAITASEEYRTGLITDAYSRYLGRSPDAGGLRDWLDRMGQGMTIQQMVASIVASPEYYNAELPNDGYWIWRLYRDVLGRDDPTGVGVRFWLYFGSDLAWPNAQPQFAGHVREAIALGILSSAEALGRQLDAEYQLFFGRGLDPSGRATWVRLLQSGVRYEVVVGSIIASDEYFIRSQRLG